MPNGGKTETRLAYRPVLDGVRGLAVVLVVCYHLELPGFHAGFVGVDIFFVLSGFLITSLLIREYDVRGSVSLPRFWARRARRLLPALLVVVLLTMAAMPSVSVFPTLGDALASLLYAANWRFIATSQSYFAEANASSPFRHMWSLAVEEHFYLLWPVAFILLWRFSQRTRWVWMTAIALASACAMALAYSPSDPSRAYFGTDTRIHQILVGALLATVMAGRRTSPRTGALLGAVGTGGLLTTLIFISDDGAFYYYGGAVMVALSTAAVIAALEAEPQRKLPPLLASRPLVALGKRSYGIYLWHWPIIVWLLQRQVQGFERTVLAIAATLLLASISFRFIEQPIRHHTSWTNRQTLVSAAAALALASVTAVGLGSRYEPPRWMTAEAGVLVTAGFDNSPRMVIALVGDSVAASLVPGFEESTMSRGMAFVSVAARGCALTDGRQVQPDGTPYTYTERCDQLIPEGIERMLETRPDLVIWYSGRDSNVHFEVNGKILVPRTPQHDAYVRKQLGEMVALLTSGGAGVAIIEPFPVPGVGCDSPGAPSSCLEWERRSAAMDHLTGILQELTGPDVLLIDADDIVCRGDQRCDPWINGERLREDGNHFSESMARFVAPQLLDLVLDAW